jgi:hypothetical protein
MMNLHIQRLRGVAAATLLALAAGHAAAEPADGVLDPNFGTDGIAMVAFDTAPATARLTEPTSDTTQSSPAAASTSETTPASTCTGAATNAKSASATAASSVEQDSAIAPRAIAASSAPADGS